MEASPFKKACDACTKAKSKCNGSNPCQLCAKRGTPCVYAFKRKRGPSKRAAQVLSDEPVLAKKAKTGVVLTPYERRLWTVFFTIFKNQESSYTDSQDRGMAWCWFARQLELLKTHCTKQDNQPLCDMIQAFLDSMNLKMRAVTSKLEKSCPFTPSVCVECATTVIRHPAAAQSHSHAGEPAPPPAQRGSARMIVRAVPEDTRDMACEPIGEFMQELVDRHESNAVPSLVFRQTDMPSWYSIKVNSAFERVFGVSEEEANKLLGWSGNGFLPWAGDIVAKLLVSEADLVTFLQIMCLKFQALGLAKGEKAYIREVPSSHSFKFWTKDATGSGAWRQQQCMMHCCHRVLKTPRHLAGHVVLSFEVIGAPYQADPTQCVPIVTRLDGNQSGDLEAGASAEPAAPAVDAPSTTDPLAEAGAKAGMPAASSLPSCLSSLDLAVDEIPPSARQYYDAWEQIDSTDLGLYPPRSQDLGPEHDDLELADLSEPQPDANESAESGAAGAAGEAALHEDTAWLEGLLDWKEEAAGAADFDLGLGLDVEQPATAVP